MGAEGKEKTENGFVSNEADKQKGEGRMEDGEKGADAPLEKVPYPKSVFFIISNEFCERFSYYGMRTILTLYLRDILLFTEDDSTIIYHVFTVFAYFFPILGAIISDSWLGKFRTILYVSIIYAAGNILLALSATGPLQIPQVPFSLIALMLIAIGTGGIKPCVSAFGGDQFVLPQQTKQLASFFSVFYFSINAGSLISTFLTPILREDVHCFGEESCFPLAFAVPGVLMIVSLVIFFMGMPLYKIRKPEGNVVVEVVKCMWFAGKKNFGSKEKVDHWLDHSTTKFGPTLVNDIKKTLKVLLVFVPLPIFFALYDQQGSRWTFQANRMDGRIGSWTLLPDQMQVVNPLLILLFIPIFNYGLYPCLAKFRLLTSPLQKMVAGGLLAALAFGISAGISAAIEANDPELPQEGMCQLRIYNPWDCAATLKIDSLMPKQVEIESMGYVYQNLECKGQKDYTYTLTTCLDALNKTGTVRLSEETGYLLYPSSIGFLVLEDDIDKPEDGLPKIRLVFGNPNSDYSATFYDGDEAELTVPSMNSSLNSIDPGTYKFGDKEYEFLLGGVYTILVDLEADGKTIKGSQLYETTEHNNIHILLQIPQYIVITVAELFLSVTGLEFSYSQAPVTMKSLLQASFLLTSAIGDVIIIIIESAKIFDKQSYVFLLYVGLMVADMLVFAYIASKYTYSKNEGEEKPEKRASVKKEEN